MTAAKNCMVECEAPKVTAERNSCYLFARKARLILLVTICVCVCVREILLEIISANSPHFIQLFMSVDC